MELSSAAEVLAQNLTLALKCVAGVAVFTFALLYVANRER